MQAISEAAYFRWARVFLFPVFAASLLLGAGVWRYGSIGCLFAAMAGEELVVEFPWAAEQVLKRGTQCGDVIRVVNISNKPIELLGARFGCKCMDSTGLPTVVMPKQKKEIPVQIRIDFAGGRNITATLYTSTVQMAYSSTFRFVAE